VTNHTLSDHNYDLHTTRHCLRMTSESAAVLNILHMHARRKVMRTNSIYYICCLVLTWPMNRHESKRKLHT